MSSTDTKKILGILVSGIMDDFTVSVCRGSVLRARELGMQPVVFPGKYINRDLSDNPELMYEYQFNTVFSYANRHNVDALIIAIGSIGSFTTQARMRELLEQYTGIPLILIGTKLDGYLSVTFDNSTGVRDGLRCLVEEKHCRNIGIISANTDNTDAMERQNAFLDFIRENKLPFRESMLVHGSYSRRSTEAYEMFLDANPDLDAVFCVNDDTSLGLYDVLRTRGLNPGTDIFVMGYDDTLAATKASPSLSTVHADGSLLGREAVSMVNAVFLGEQVRSRTISTQFVRRDSFGSLPSGESAGDSPRLLDADAWFSDIFYRYDNLETADVIDSLRGTFRLLIAELEQGFSGETPKVWERKHFSGLLNEFLNLKNAVAYADAGKMISALEDVYQLLLTQQTNDRSRFILRDTFALIYSRLYRAMDQETGRIFEEKERTSYSMKLFIRDMLQFERGNDASYASLLGNLGWLSIEHARLYLFEAPVTHCFGEPFSPPDTLYQKAFLENGRVALVPESRQAISINALFSLQKQAADDDLALVLFPLFYGTTLYGLLLCDLTDALFSNGEFLINQMSSATRMIHLLHTNELITQQLEDSLALLRKNNLDLDTLSKSDALTGILNRRGFFEATEKFITDNRSLGFQSILFFIDMNNLKTINDCYGHEEGDFSLNTIGHYLEESVKEGGICARIGGDEFACVIQANGTEEGSRYKKALMQRFSDFNETSKKPYYVTVSIGFYVIMPDSPLTLKEVLTLADEQMYQEKQRIKSKISAHKSKKC